MRPEALQSIGLVVIGGLVLVVFLLIVRMAQGPKFTDRIVVVNTIGNIAIAAVAIYGICWDAPGYIDISLTLALLNFFTVTLLSRIIIANRNLHKRRNIHPQQQGRQETQAGEEAQHD